MHPPKRSLRSSTQTRRPPFESSAAHASALTPLPTTITSCSATAQFPELVVGDEPALLYAARLHLREQLGVPALGNVEAELLHLDPGRVEAALLAEDDPAL